MPTETIEISSSIIDQINSVNESWKIIAYNNDVTPFNVVFYVLKSVIPLSDDEAYNKTLEIHLFGKSMVYMGSKEHCEKIGAAFKLIRVEYDITND